MSATEVEYTVIETVCELCDEVNDHLTADCPHITCDRQWVFRTFDSFLAFVYGHMTTLMWLGTRLAQ